MSVIRHTASVLRYAISVLFFSILLLAACKKHNDATPITPLSVTGIFPDSGIGGTPVYIAGTHLDGGASVTFNGLTAKVLYATDDTLLVEVPAKAGTGPVKVSVGGGSVTGPSFNYIYVYTVSTVAGSGTAGSANGKGIAASFDLAVGMEFDKGGNLYVSDLNNQVVRKITIQ